MLEGHGYPHCGVMNVRILHLRINTVYKLAAELLPPSAAKEPQSKEQPEAEESGYELAPSQYHLASTVSPPLVCQKMTRTSSGES